MKTILEKIIGFCECENGSSMPEYALIAGLSGSAIIFGMDGMKADMLEAFRNIGKRMVEATKFPPL